MITVILGLGIFYGVLFPAMVMMCHKRWPTPDKPPGYWWGLFILWPLTHYIYAMLYIRKPSYGLHSILGILWLFLFGMTLAGTNSKYKKDLKVTLTQHEKVISKSKGLSMDEKADINGSLMILKNEIKNITWSDFETRKRQSELVDSLSRYLEDNELSKKEYQQWMQSYKDRSSRAPASSELPTKRAN